MNKNRLMNIGIGATVFTVGALGVNYLIHKNDKPVDEGLLKTNTFEPTGVIKYAPDETIYQVVVGPEDNGADCVVYDGSEGQTLNEAKKVLGPDPSKLERFSNVKVTNSGSIKIVCESFN